MFIFYLFFILFGFVFVCLFVLFLFNFCGGGGGGGGGVMGDLVLGFLKGYFRTYEIIERSSPDTDSSNVKVIISLNNAIIIFQQ